MYQGSVRDPEAFAGKMSAYKERPQTAKNRAAREVDAPVSPLHARGLCFFAAWRTAGSASQSCKNFRGGDHLPHVALRVIGHVHKSSAEAGGKLLATDASEGVEV